MEFSITYIVLLTFLFLIVCLWRSSHVFRYYAKLCLFASNFLFTGLVVLLPTLLRPCDAANIGPVRTWWNFSFSFLGLKIEKRNVQRLQNAEKSAIIIVNHQSNFDIIPVFQMAPKRSTYLAKKELLYFGTFGIGAWLCGVVFIDRYNKEKARETMAKVAKIIHSEKIRLWIFPEGTRNFDGTFRPFKKGAFHLAIQAQVPIYPVVMSSYRHWLDEKRKILNPGGHVIASSLPPFYTKGLTTDDIDDLIEKVRDAMFTEFKKISIEAEARGKADDNTLLKD